MNKAIKTHLAESRIMTTQAFGLDPNERMLCEDYPPRPGFGEADTLGLECATIPFTQALIDIMRPWDF